MKNLATVVLLCAGLFYALLLSAQIGTKVQQQQSITGTWLNSDFGYQMKLVLHADGTGEFDGEAIRYKSDSKQLTITQAGQSTTYTFTLNGNALTLSGGDIDGSINFSRTSGQVTSQQPITNIVTETPKTTENSLVGKWSAQGESIEFTSQGKCLYFGQTFDYQLSGNQLTLVTAQGNAVFVYAVQGDQLNLTANGQTISYTKGEKQHSAPASGKGQIAQELVGKWCYVNVTSSSSGGSISERCITLHPNGTYEYYGESSRSVNTNSYYGGTNSQNSDNGTWTYDGQNLYYNSTAGGGSGAYRLEKRNHPKNNDPMIVLDGETYVTFYQKAAWR